jgi:hypothetical protein
VNEKASFCLSALTACLLLCKNLKVYSELEVAVKYNDIDLIVGISGFVYLSTVEVQTNCIIAVRRDDSEEDRPIIAGPQSSFISS